MRLATRRAHARAMFAALVEAKGNDLPLDLCAAWMSAEEQGTDEVGDMLASIEAVAAEVHIPADANIFERVARLNHHLFTVHGFRGNTDEYDAPENSMLGMVLERRTGLPILLSLLYIEVARRHDISVDGIGFPTHFVVQPHDADPVFFVDCFHQGRVLRMDHMRAWFDRIVAEKDVAVSQLERWLHPLPPRLMLVRMNQNLKVAYMRRGDLEGALRSVERMLILMPDSIDVRRDRGLLRLELGLEEEGAKDLDAYLAAQKRPATRLRAYDE
jgi:regulator of sirC expression with transglutaminase-like and TPR domain